MRQVVIDNPILNSPFDEPARYYHFDDDGITDQVVEGRRPSSYFIPIAQPKKKSKQLTLDSLLPQDRAKENDHVNHVRGRVRYWRNHDYPGVTATTRALLEHWTRKDRERRLFFCQVEALETLIFLTEAADKQGDGNILARLRADLDAAGTTLFRQACKMATGAGKTVVMAMLIAWHTLNRAAGSRDRRFADAFLVVAPGITIRDRLRVLLPSDPANYYRGLDLVPVEHLAALGTAKIVITNFHTFKPRETVEGPKITKHLASGGRPNAFTEKPDQMARRVCRELGGQREIVVLNDEAHHCYRSKPDAAEKLIGDERKEAEQREEEARLWITGLEAIDTKIGIKTVYDLSATPFYLKGSGYPEGTLFPWVVSDFSLIDAIESGIVKIPRVPVADDTLGGDLPTFRELWLRIRDTLPKKGRGTDKVSGPPQLPKELEAALQALYSHYERAHREWRDDPDGETAGRTPPVFIVVCNNTTVSKLVFDHLAGYEVAATHADGTPKVAAGRLPLFSNVDHGRWVARPNTILVDSAQLESDDGMSPEFKKLAAHQIDEFKAEYRQRFPDRDAEALTDTDLMREVLNTVGKAGKLGEHVRCVVSVSMLTEGWDCLDSDTEILTPGGWVGRGQVEAGDLVYSLDRSNGRLVAVPVLEYGERQVRPGERMTRVRSQHLDIRVTEGHEFHVKYRDPRRGGALSQSFLSLTGRELAGRRSAYAIPLAAEHARPFPGVPLSDDELRFVAWFMTDGGFSRTNVVVSQSKPFRNEIRGLLTKLELDFTERIVLPTATAFGRSNPLHTFRVPKGTHTGSLARRGWFPYREYLDKAVAPVLHRMTRDQFRTFWAELLKGDGEQQGARSGWLWCSDKRQADAYTHMAIVRGFTASTHPEITATGNTVYRVSVRDAQWITSDPADPRASRVTLESPEPGEIVWCVRNPNSTLVTRRGGKVAILGNCNTVTHILGVRAFGTQLLCEQVVGRGLRRMSYTLNEKGHFDPEYAEAFGVPFSFIPCSGIGSEKEKKDPVPKPGRIKALPERVALRPHLEVTFPRLTGYRYEMPPDRLTAKFTKESKLVLSTADLPTWTENAPVVGETVRLTLDDLKRKREQEVAFAIARLVLQQYYPAGPADAVAGDATAAGGSQVWLYPQVVAIVKRWMAECVVLKDSVFPQLLLLAQLAHSAAEKVHRAIAGAAGGEPRVRAILQPYDTVGSSAVVSFDSRRGRLQTDPTKCHVNFVVYDSDWERHFAQTLEGMAEVRAYVKNEHLGFKVPYTHERSQRHYYPDYLVRVDDGRGPDDLLTLVVELSGEDLEDKQAKADTARTLWVPAVNAEERFGRWAYLEIKDPLSAQREMRAFLARSDRV